MQGSSSQSVKAQKGPKKQDTFDSASEFHGSTCEMALTPADPSCAVRDASAVVEAGVQMAELDEVVFVAEQFVFVGRVLLELQGAVEEEAGVRVYLPDVYRVQEGSYGGGDLRDDVFVLFRRGT